MKQVPNDYVIDGLPGPSSVQNIAVLLDLGLTDGEIARYHKVDRQTVNRIRHHPLTAVMLQEDSLPRTPEALGFEDFSYDVHASHRTSLRDFALSVRRKLHWPE